MTANSDPNDLQALKASVDLVALFKAHGVDVRKFGRGFKARCVFHTATTPSMSLEPKKGVYHCFGCGESGDHLTFLQRHVKLSFHEAVAELRQLAGQPAPQEKPQLEEPFPYDLMARVAEVWRAWRCSTGRAFAATNSSGSAYPTCAWKKP